MAAVPDLVGAARPNGLAHQRTAFLAMLAFFLVAPFVAYPIFLMKVMCFALFACAFNLLIGYGGLVSFGHAMFLGTAGYASAHAATIAHCSGLVSCASSIRMWSSPPSSLNSTHGAMPSRRNKSSALSTRSS